MSGGIAQLFLNHGTRRGCVVSIKPRPPLPRERPGTHCTGGWVGPGAGLERCGKSRPTGIRSPELPARSESLYLLRYPGSHFLQWYVVIYQPHISCLYCYDSLRYLFPFYYVADPRETCCEFSDTNSITYIAYSGKHAGA